MATSDASPLGQGELRQLLAAVVRIKQAPDGRLDMLTSSATDTLELGELAESSAKLLAEGLAMLGWLVAATGDRVERGGVSQMQAEALGRLIAELADLVAACTHLAADCRAARVSGALQHV